MGLIEHNYDDVDRAAGALTSRGDAWRDHLPDGAVITDDGAPDVYDTVKLADGNVIYRRDTDPDAPAPYWVTLGWSDASKARRYRPIPADLRPFDPTEHDPT